MAIDLSKVAGAVDALPGGKLAINAVDFVVNWARSNSLWPLVYGTSCCAIEMMATGAAKHDIARFGAEVFRASPRQADLIILAGTLTEKMSEHLRTLYEQMPEPKYAIAMGVCTISGGPFYYDSYSVVKGADRIIPVDVFIPGCPPRPEALLNGLMELQKIIKGETIRKPRIPPPLNEQQMTDRHTETMKAWTEEDAKRQEELEPQRAKFKEENPDYKGYKHQRIDKGDFPKLDYEARPRVGTEPWAIWQLVHEKFPEVTLADIEEPSEESLAEQGTEYVPEFIVGTEQYQAFASFLKSHAELNCDLLLQVTAVDWPEAGEHGEFHVYAHFYSIQHKHLIFVRCEIPRDQPEIDTLSHLYPTADWHEREVYDLFGITFRNHPDLRRIFLWEGFEGHPLRKDFEDPTRVVKRPY